LNKNTIETQTCDTAFVAKNPISHYKETIRQHTEQISGAFWSGAPVSDLLHSRSDLLDGILINSWNHYLAKDLDCFTLVAIGGYGRREMHPYSDIDILLLHCDNIDQKQAHTLEDFLRLLWDIGLKLGHRVSTVDECRESALEDQVYTTALLESRLLYGPADLFEGMKEQTGPDSVWSSTEFFEAKIEEQRKRYARYNDTGFSLEPNVKEGPGGLRDFQTIAWLKKRHYRTDTLRELVDEKRLTTKEYEELLAGQEFLWKIRFALHILTGRAEDRLMFNLQTRLAEQFGYEDTAKSSAVEQFMQNYYRTVMNVERLSEMLLQLFGEDIFAEEKAVETEPINLHFQSVGKFIEVTKNTVFEEYPPALLEIFLLEQQIPSLKGIRASTIRLIGESLSLIDDDFRKNPACCQIFLEILSQRKGVTKQLRHMTHYGVLSAYLPAFGHIVGRIQYDLFHVYTVDQHTLFLIRNLRRFALDEHNNELPFCNGIFMLIARPALLYLAALMHDIAKGKGGDHSVLGEKIARQFCRTHRLTGHETDLVAWLVRHHLLMSMTAQKKDLSNPKVIHEFATRMGTIERLNYLYLLTVADIRATNPEMWNSWKDSLLKELYRAAHKMLHKGINFPLDQHKRIRNSRREAHSTLERLGLSGEAIDLVWKDFGDDYFRRYSTDEAVWHTIAISSSNPRDLPLVILRPQNQRGAVEILLYTLDEDHLFSRSTAILDQLGLTILDARIVTTSNTRVINSYLVLEQSGEPIRDLYRAHQICHEIKDRMSTPARKAGNNIRRATRQVRYFPITPTIVFDDEPIDGTTLMELTAADQPGLLSKIGQAFNRFNLKVHQAKIMTIGSRAEDIFYLSDHKNQPIESETLQEDIRQALIETISQ